MAKTKASGTQASRDTTPKVEMIRQAIAALGKDAGAAEIQTYAREKFKREISQNHIYTTLRGTRGTKQKVSEPLVPVPTLAAPVPMTVTLAIPTASLQPAEIDSSVDLKDVLAVKALLERVGPQKMRAILELFES